MISSDNEKNANLNKISTHVRRFIWRIIKAKAHLLLDVYGFMTAVKPAVGLTLLINLNTLFNC